MCIFSKINNKVIFLLFLIIPSICFSNYRYMDVEQKQEYSNPEPSTSADFNYIDIDANSPLKLTELLIEEKEDIYSLKLRASKQPSTLEFFSGLLNCNPGHYFEKNTSFGKMGPKLLSHIILSSAENMCKVILDTPDDNKLNCFFNKLEIETLTTPYFLESYAVSENKNSISSIVSEVEWGRVKLNSCIFPYP